jgi:hypothetical protein
MVLVMGIFSCGTGDEGDGNGNGSVTLVSITVDPADQNMAIGGTQQFTATGTYSDDSTDDITADVEWSSSDEGVATIDENGLATVIAEGTTTITATLDGESGTATLTVQTLDSIAVTPANTEIEAEATQQFTATGTFSDSSTSDITASVTWSSSDETIATIGSTGLATAVASGTTTITATLGDISGETTLAVTVTSESEWDIITVDVEGGVAVGTNSSLAIASDNTFRISYYDETNKKLKFAESNASGAWGTTIVDDSAGCTSIAVDTNRDSHIAYQGLNEDLMYATNEDEGDWVITTVEAGVYACLYDDISIALDNNNKAYISYFDGLNYDLKYATNATGAWVTAIIVNGSIGGPNLPGYSASIKLDSDDKIHISYYDESAPDRIMYITNASGLWVPTTIDDENMFSAGWETSLAIDDDNKIHITYYKQPEDTLEYATNVTGSWVITPIDDTSGNVWNAAIAIDSGDKAHVCYGSGEAFKYATNATGSWVSSDVDAPYTGGDCSIAVDDDDGIHISYYDGFNMKLKYASKTE